VSEPPPVQVENVSLAYRLTRNRAGTLKEFAFQMLKRQVSFEKLWAVDGVSFEVRRGEVFALIGANGAGKTTLMKVVARVLPPTGGRVIVRGVVAPMISLGAGFNPELTGYENIVLYGTLLGREPEYMRGRAQTIAEWAGLTDFLDVPVRSYSSGMLARLGFSIASDIDPDVLVVDEVLAVGDEEFQKKSYDRMQQLMGSGTAVLLVSHALEKVLDMSDRVMWLDKGKVKMIGDPHEVVGSYKAAVG
jgi:ABC-type polysaccharide/polyol phosphate transport system ATPase subunit